MTEQYGEHYSVLLNECIDFLPEFTNDEIYVDGTFGAGGHSFAIINKFPHIKIIGIDQDQSAIENGQKNIAEKNLTEKISLVHMNFSEFPKWFKKNFPNKKIKALLIDLGVSSHQFDTPERGFSFRFDADLDMRMNQDNDLTAKEVVNTFSEQEISDILYNLGEEKFANVIARNIVAKRDEAPVQTTKQLEDIIFHSYPKKFRFGRTHPATKSFQALRIYVNQELKVLENSLEEFWDILDKNGRLLAISFHSLEDRIVKHKYREIFHKDKKAAKILTKKPITASAQELEENTRSRSAKLRVIEKLYQGQGSLDESKGKTF